MNENARYKIGGSFYTRAELLAQAAETAKTLDPETAKVYLSFVSKTLEFDMEQERLLQNENFKQDKFRTRTMPLIGLLLVVGMFCWAYFFPFPSYFQSGIYWVGFCLFVALAFFLVMGYFHIEQRIGEVAVKAGGPMGIFFLMYFLPPHVMKGEQQSVKKVDVIVMRSDTTVVQKISADFNPSEQTEIAAFVTKTLKDYNGAGIVDTFTCFRRSDGKIVDFEKCSSLGNEPIIAISLAAIRHFKNPREAYEHFLKKIE